MLEYLYVLNCRFVVNPCISYKRMIYINNKTNNKMNNKTNNKEMIDNDKITLINSLLNGKKNNKDLTLLQTNYEKALKFKCLD